MNTVTLLHRFSVALLLLGALFCIACNGSGGARSSGKPGAPLTVVIEPRGEIERGKIGEFTVVATAFAASDDFALDVALPDEMALYSGDLHQNGTVAARTQFRLTFSVRVPESGVHRITATARMRVGDAGHFEVNSTYVIGESPRPPVRQDGVSTQRENEAIREFGGP